MGHWISKLLRVSLVLSEHERHKLVSGALSLEKVWHPCPFGRLTDSITLTHPHITAGTYINVLHARLVTLTTLVSVPTIICMFCCCVYVSYMYSWKLSYSVQPENGVVPIHAIRYISLHNSRFPRDNGTKRPHFKFGDKRFRIAKVIRRWKVGKSGEKWGTFKNTLWPLITSAIHINLFWNFDTSFI